jgi:hypothetical protein
VKKLAFMLMLLIAAVAVPAPAQDNDAASLARAMHSCQTFSDCMIVYGCGDEAINKLYEKQYKAPAVCTVTKAHDPKADPTCEEGKCMVVDITKEDGQ